jgi:hypothetical protein
VLFFQNLFNEGDYRGSFPASLWLW